MVSRLRYPILFQLALLLFSPIQPYQLSLATSFLAYSLLCIAISSSSRLYLFQVSTILLLLLILYYSSCLSILVVFLAAVICSVFSCSSCCTNFAFPSHTPPAYSNFGTTTFIRIHLLILVSRCGSVSIASILPTCDFRGEGGELGPCIGTSWRILTSCARNFDSLDVQEWSLYSAD